MGVFCDAFFVLSKDQLLFISEGAYIMVVLFLGQKDFVSVSVVSSQNHKVLLTGNVYLALFLNEFYLGCMVHDFLTLLDR